MRLFDDYLVYPNPNHERLILHPTYESEVEKEAQELDTSKAFLIFLLKLLNGVHLFLPLYLQNSSTCASWEVFTRTV